MGNTTNRNYPKPGSQAENVAIIGNALDAIDADVQDALEGADGALKIVNNFSDVDDVPAALENLGLGAPSLLAYAETTDRQTAAAIAAATWTDVIPNQTFIMPAGFERANLSVQGSLRVGGMATAGFISTRILIDDGAFNPPFIMIGAVPDVPIGAYVNPLAGSSLVSFGAIAAGAHTVKLQVRCDYAATMDLKVLSQPDYYFLRVIVQLRR